MSATVDTAFTPAERAALLADLRALLAAFLSPSAAEREDPLGDVSALLDLEPADLERVTCVHVLLQPTIQRLLADLDHDLRRPQTSSVRPRETAHAIRGPVDWPATHALRAAGGSNRTAYVVRPARRAFDTPENRALAWLLAQLEEAAAAALGRHTTADGWLGRVRVAQATLWQARRVRWLRSVPPARPDAAVLARLAVARSRFYRRVGRAARMVQRWREQPSGQDLVALLCERWFEPARDAELFEVAVALRVATAFAAVSPGPRRMRLLVGGKTPAAAFARYDLPDGDTISLWYQHWPPRSGASAHTDALERHGMHARPTRPDLIVERTGTQRDAVVIELKASRSRSYLARGLSQLLGYLQERPQMFAQRPAGWLVAPDGGPFAPAEPDGLLWMLNADAVADAAVARFYRQPR